MSYESDCDDCDDWAEPNPCADTAPCIDCGAHGLCECWRDELDLEDQLDCLLCDGESNCPNCDDEPPF
jgi:hypothetical protein